MLTRNGLAPASWLVLGLLSGALGAARAQAATPVVECDGGRISVTARSVDLAALLEQVARRCRFTLVLAGTVDAKVSRGFTDLPLQEGLRRLLQGQDYIIEEPVAGAPATLRVMGRSGQGSAVVVRAPAVTSNTNLGTLRTALDSSDPAVRADAALALGDSGEPQAVSLLAPLLTDADEIVREAAFLALTDLGGEASAQAVAGVLGDDRVSVRAAAVDALTEMETPDITPLLAPALLDPEEQVRNAAFAAMAERRSPAAVNGLSQALRDPRPQVRLAAVETLGEIPGDAALLLLRDATADDVEEVRDAATEAIESRQD